MFLRLLGTGCLSFIFMTYLWCDLKLQEGVFVGRQLRGGSLSLSTNRFRGGLFIDFALHSIHVSFWFLLQAFLSCSIQMKHDFRFYLLCLFIFGKRVHWTGNKNKLPSWQRWTKGNMSWHLPFPSELNFFHLLFFSISFPGHNKNKLNPYFKTLVFRFT